MKRRPLGLGPIPVEPPISATRQVTVRQASAVGISAFLFLVMGVMAVGVLYQPGETVQGDNAFLDRFFFGILVVPSLYGAERFFLRARVVVADSGVSVHNPFRTAVLPWPSIGGAVFDGGFHIVLAGGDRLGSVLFGPTFSSPLTQRARVDQLVALVNAEAARRSGRTHDPDAAYEAELLIGSVGAGSPDVDDAASKWRFVWGLPSLAIYAALWTVACALVSAAA